MSSFIKKYDNVISFHGSDHKTGVTMISLSVCADICRKDPEKNVMFIGMNGRPSCEYVSEEVFSIEDIKMHLDNRTLTSEEIKMMCRSKKNFYMLSGIKDLIKEREFFPETAEYLLRTISECFDIIICDTGNDPDNGLAIGALHGSGQSYCVISQCESSVNEFERRSWLFKKLGIDFNAFVLNKYFPKDPYDRDYLAERLGKNVDCFITVRMAGYGRQAEMDHQTLLEYRNDAYGRDISILSQYIMSKAGISVKNERRRRLWKAGSIWLTK